MKTRKHVRIALDVVLTFMIVFEMLIQLTGAFLHEVIGAAFFVTVVLHVALSAAWVKSTARNAKEGKLTARRTALAVVGSLLALCTVILGVSSVAISNILYSAGFVWPIGSYALWVSVHTASAYALCALTVVHLAMHWVFLASAFKVPYDPSRRRAISAGVNTVAALGVLALSATAAGKLAVQVAGADVAPAASEDAGAIEAEAALAAPSGKGTKKAKSSGSSAGAAATGASGSSGSSSSSGSSASSGSSGTSSASGICTLCRKQCSLSAPKCDKPYAAGLL